MLIALTLGHARAADSDLYFEDDFSSSSERYFFEGNLDERYFQYVDDEYEIDTTAGKTYGQSVLLEEMDGYSVEVAGRMVETSDPNGGFGLSFNYQERPDGSGSDFLLLLAYDRGAYTVLRYYQGRTTVLFAPTKTKLFKSGEWVTLRAETSRGNCTCYINGVEVAKVKEDTLKSGGFGVFATEAAIARFDDFRVYSSAGGGARGEGFSDEMDGGTLFSGSYDTVEYRFKDGEYIIDTSESAKIGLSPYARSARDFELSCDVSLQRGDPVNGYGIYVRDHPAEGGGYNQIRLLVSGGWFAVEQSKDDQPLALTQWTEDPLVRASGTNRLTIRARGEDVVFLINGQEVYRMTDEDPQPGSFGLYASSGIEAAFDNLEFTELK
ncbi:DUF1080 domain-containing protein [bacterium]|nr:DUF1080 domain-containing protein [bacterium]